MVVVGGITRLTHSGLSMVEWHLFMGSIPPLNHADWIDIFKKYQQFPEFQELNYDFKLDDFKSIFWWEYIHRMIGRLLGIVFIVPFSYFLVKRRLSKKLIKQSAVMFSMGALQGFLGWFMVKSGLVDKPDVSHYRLAMHLTTAFLTFAYTFWVALDLIFPSKKEINTRFRNLIRVGLVILVIQIIWGAFVAGLDAGWIHNHWPLMNDGELIHQSVTTEQEPLWRNFIEGKSGVQFIHRYLAYIVVGIIGFIWFKARKNKTTTLQQKGINLLLILVGVQFVLGVLTLVLFVPVWLGVLHQVTAFILLATMTFTLHRYSK